MKQITVVVIPIEGEMYEVKIDQTKFGELCNRLIGYNYIEYENGSAIGSEYVLYVNEESLYKKSFIRNKILQKASYPHFVAGCAIMTKYDITANHGEGESFPTTLSLKELQTVFRKNKYRWKKMLFKQ